METSTENIILLKNIDSIVTNIDSIVKKHNEEIFFLKNEIKCLKDLLLHMSKSINKEDNNKQPISKGWIVS